VISRTLPGWYDLRQYQIYISIRCEVISSIYLTYTNSNTKFIPASYQAKISLGLNTRTKLVWKFHKGPDIRTRLIWKF
jgi:hypothetical protein